MSGGVPSLTASNLWDGGSAYPEGRMDAMDSPAQLCFSPEGSAKFQVAFGAFIKFASAKFVIIYTLDRNNCVPANPLFMIYREIANKRPQSKQRFSLDL